MKAISNIVNELVGLFVDDGSLAVATIAILVTVGVARHVNLISSTSAAVLLCIGLVIVIVENVLRSAQRIERKNLGRNK
jgi:ABC-type arginine/histidine transport system permease subunit